MKHKNTIHYSSGGSFFSNIYFLFVFWAFIILNAFTQDIASDNSLVDNADDKLINEYIDSKGNKTICFTHNNIKQFWIDNSIISLNGSIVVSLQNNHESIIQKIQLINVTESMDCNIEVITENHDAYFSIYNQLMEPLSSSKKEDPFLGYERLSSSFHLEDTDNFAFNIKFFSSAFSNLRIKAIILSFSENQTRLTLNVPPTVEELSSPVPQMSSDNISINGDFEKELSGQQLEKFRKQLLDMGNQTYLSNNYLFPEKLTLGLRKNNASSPPLLYLSSENPISGHYSFLVDTTQNKNSAQFAYQEIKKGNYIYWGLIKGIGNEPSEITIRPCYFDAPNNKVVYLHTIKINIKPNTLYKFQGTVRFAEIKAQTFSLHFLGSGNFLMDNLNIIPQQ